jgi:glycosyltransferase involved in cell wall biosynthesis
MERVLTDPNLAEALAEAGYLSARSKFSPETIQAKYLELLT